MPIKVAVKKSKSSSAKSHTSEGGNHDQAAERNNDVKSAESRVSGEDNGTELLIKHYFAY